MVFINIRTVAFKYQLRGKKQRRRNVWVGWPDSPISSSQKILAPVGGGTRGEGL